MNGIDYLKSLFYENFSIELSSSVFREMVTWQPRVVIWADGFDVKITSIIDYHVYKNLNPDIIKLFEIYDMDKCIEIYRIAAFGYKYDSEEILSNLIKELERNYKKELK